MINSDFALGAGIALFSHGWNCFCERLLQYGCRLHFSLTVGTVFVRDFCNHGADAHRGRRFSCPLESSFQNSFSYEPVSGKLIEISGIFSENLPDNQHFLKVF